MRFSLSAFEDVYRDAVTDVMSYYSPSMQASLCLHNAAWRAGSTDFEQYLRRSWIRGYIALSAAAARGATSICDVGGFWGVLPLVARRLGMDAALTEAMTYYGAAFDPLFGFLQGEGVRIHDMDLFDDGVHPPGDYDFVCLMAVLEHYPHSVETPMRLLWEMVGETGHLYVEVPNIAYLPKRLGLLRGVSPLVDIRLIWESAVPFIGHHHEYTVEELRRLSGLAGFRIEEEWFYNYSTDRRLNSAHGAWAFIESVGGAAGAALYALSPTLRECISAVMSRDTVSHDHPRLTHPTSLVIGLRG